MNKKLKIVFVGIPDMALVCLSNLLIKKFDIVGVVPPKKNHETYNYFAEFVKNHSLNMIDFDKTPNEEECIEQLKKLNADIGVVCSYNTLLSEDFLSTTKMGYINCHPSILPYYRGAAPYFHVVNNGEKISGITLHFMDKTFDTGDIIYQKQFKLFPFETMGTIFNRTTFMLSDALCEILEKIQNGIEIKRIKQKQGNFTTAPKVDGNFRIRWKNHSVFETDRLIRACNPFYNAFTTFRNVNLKIVKAHIIEKEHQLEDGRIALANERQILIAQKGGYLSLDVIQMGTWGILMPYDFYYLFNPNTDEFLV